MTMATESEFERRVVAAIDFDHPDFDEALAAALARAAAELAEEERPWALVSIEREGGLEGSRGQGRPDAPDYLDLLAFAGPVAAIAEAIEVECEANSMDATLEAFAGLVAADIGF